MVFLLKRKNVTIFENYHYNKYYMLLGGRRGRDHVIVEFTTICEISVYHHWSYELIPPHG